jgi:DNA-binding Lrp family transcriptional regulator
MSQTSFTKVMGNSSRNKILDFFIEGDRHDWTFKEIFERTNLSESTLKRILPELVDTGIIKVERIIGNNKLYKIDKENIIVKELYRLHNTITNEEMNREIKKQKIKKA